MGFLDFDAREYLKPEGSPPAKVANPAKVEPAPSTAPAPVPAKTLATLAALADLPPDIADGVAKLRAMRAPRWTTAERWRVFVGDAAWLIDSGVAADALGQGWTPLDLFGVSADEQWQCLCAWMEGKRDEFNRAVILLREMRGDQTRLYATQALSGRRRWHYPDPAPKDARLAWTI